MPPKKKKAPAKKFDARDWGFEGTRRKPRGADYQPPDQHSESLLCTVRGNKPRFMAQDESFAIWNVVVEEDGKSADTVIQGPLARVAAGEMLRCAGRWKRHPKHGWSFQVQRYESALPVNDSGVAAWLETRVDGIGPTFARSIVKHFGADKVFEVLDADPGKLADVRSDKGRALPAAQVQKAVEAWDDARAIRQIETFLFSHGVSANLADRLYRQYGEEVVEILQERPYQITEMRGIGFRIADRVARSMGIALDAPERLEAGIVFVLEEAESEGHVFLGLENLLGRCMDALEVGKQEPLVEAASRLAAEGKIVAEQDEALVQRIYLRWLHRVECRLARTVRAMREAPRRPLYSQPERPTAPEGAAPEEIEALRLPTDEQWEVMEDVRGQRLTILSGNPGVGKCVRGDTPVLIDGRYIKIEDLWKEEASDPIRDNEGEWAKPRRDIHTASINDQGKIEERPVVHLYRQYVEEPGQRIELADGSQISMTRRHRLLSPEGWTNTILPGDRIAVPGIIPEPFGAQSISPHLAKLLAWQLAEGHERSEKSGSGLSADLRISQKDTKALEDLKESAESWSRESGVSLNRMRLYTPKGRTPFLCTYSTEYRRFLEERGYRWGDLSRSKRIPDFVMQTDNKTVRIFLREWMSCEGSVIEKLGRVEASSASREMLEQISLLLRRFGVWMRIREKRSRATNGSRIWRTYYNGTISGPSLRAFSEKVGIEDRRKETLLQEIASRPTNANLETVPVGPLLRMLLLEAGSRKLGLSSSYRSGTKNPSRSTLEKIIKRARAIDDLSSEGKGLVAQLQKTLAQEVYWVEVRSVEDIDLREWVYDLEIANDHNYVAGGIISHNTQSVNEIVRLAESHGLHLKLCAPTGKAARRMAELTDHEATTIHRLLEFSPWEGGFQRDEQNPLEADLVVVDEASMLSLDLADSLFRAISDDTHLLLVGDPDQLPPVGVGKVLDDLITSEAVPRVHLSKIFRQAARSMIIQNSRRINSGRIPYLSQEEAEKTLEQKMLNDFYWVTRKEPEATLELTVDMATRRIPQTFGFDPRSEIMVLAPMRKGKVGLEILNERLEAELNPEPEEGEKTLVVPRRNIYVGSRIVQTKNSYDEHHYVMNGELAMVLDYKKDSGEALLSLDDGEREIWVPAADMDSYMLAWAMSVHRAQGSQWPCVVAPVSSSFYIMLTRSLVYTAVTRASKLCVMTGEKRALQMAVDKIDARQRNSTLAARILDPSLSGELF